MAVPAPAPQHGTALGRRARRHALRWGLLPLLLAVLQHARRAAAHAGCVHSRKAVRVPAQQAQAYAPLPAGRRQSEDDFLPIRITLDFALMEGASAAQQLYVKQVTGNARDWLQQALRVRRIAGNLVVPEAFSCGDVQGSAAALVSSTYYSHGIEDTDILIFVLAQAEPPSGHGCFGGATRGYASACVLDANDRPVVGYVQLCAAHFHPTLRADGSAKTPKDAEEDRDMVLHEIIHILGMSNALFPFFRDQSLKPRTARCPTTQPPPLEPGVSISGGTVYWYEGAEPSTYSKDDLDAWCCRLSDTRGAPPFRCNSFSSSNSVVESGVFYTSRSVVQTISLPGSSLGQKQTVLKTPAVVALAKQHFKCDALTGVTLEDDGGPGIAGSHWDKRILMNELMVGELSGMRTSSSAFSLAVLEDSGWYRANFGVTDALAWGLHAGCSFLSCAPRAGVESGEFCQAQSSDARRCTFDRAGFGKCTGGAPYMDGCPFVEPIFMCSNWDGKAGDWFRKCPNTSENYCTGSRFGPGTACFESDLFDITAAGFNATGVACYEYECEKESTMSNRYKLKIGGEACEPNKQITVNGFNGYITCPSEWQIFCNSSLKQVFGTHLETVASTAVSSPKYVVSMQLLLPMTPAEFTQVKENLFILSIATLCNVHNSDIVITGKTPVQRRSSGIRIDFEILATDWKSAEAIKERLVIDNINKMFKSNGIPDATVVKEASIQEYNKQILSDSGAASVRLRPGLLTSVFLAALLIRPVT